MSRTTIPSLCFATLKRVRTSVQQRCHFDQERRSLMTLAFASQIKKTLGGHEIAAFQSYTFPRLDSYKYKVKVVDNKEPYEYDNVGKAVRQHGGSGKLLQPVIPSKKAVQLEENTISTEQEEQTLDDLPNTSSTPLPVLTFKPINKKLSFTKKLNPGHCKSVRFTAGSANSPYFSMMISKAWLFLRNGMEVEVIVYGKSPEDVKNIILRNPHLHMDSILSAMPPYTGIIIQPQIHQKTLHWTMGPAKRLNGGPPNRRYCKYAKPDDITPKFLKARESVIEDLIKGKIKMPLKKQKAWRDLLDFDDQFVRKLEIRHLETGHYKTSRLAPLPDTLPDTSTEV